MPPALICTGFIIPGDKVYAVGWGRQSFFPVKNEMFKTHRLKKAEITIQNFEVCKTYFTGEIYDDIYLMCGKGEAKGTKPKTMLVNNLIVYQEKH